MKKVLVVFGEGTQKNTLIDSAVFLKEKFGYEILPLYIKDVRRDEIIPATMDGMIVSLSNNSFVEENDELEDEEVKHLQEKLHIRGADAKLRVEFGFPWDIIKEYLKAVDLLIFEKGEMLSESAITVLKNNFKPIIMVGEKAISSFDNIGVSNDDGVKINKSVFEFMNSFSSIENFTLMTLLYKTEDNSLLNYLEGRDKKVECKNFDGDNAKEEYMAAVNNLDMLIMGNLSSSYFFEKLTGKKGIAIMEKSKTSIFVG